MIQSIGFPVVDCKSCSGTCGAACHAKFSMRWIFAWANGEPLPECSDWRQSYQWERR